MTKTHWSLSSQGSSNTCAPTHPQPCMVSYSQRLDSRPQRQALPDWPHPSQPHLRPHYFHLWISAHAGLSTTSLDPPVQGLEGVLEDSSRKSSKTPSLGLPQAYLACSASHHHLGCVLAEYHLLHTKPGVITVGVKAAHLGSGME